MAHRDAENYFGFKILSVQSDNGSEFRGSYHDWLTRKNISHHFIPKSLPNWNPHVGRTQRRSVTNSIKIPAGFGRQLMNGCIITISKESISLNGLTLQEGLESVTIKC